MKNNYYLSPSLRAIWKRQFRHIFMLGFVGILLGLSSSGEVLGQTTVLSQNFDGITMGTTPSAVYTIDNGNSGCSGAADLWRITSANPSCSCTCNTDCSGNRAVIDYGGAACSQDVTLVVGSFSGYASVDVSFDYAADIDGTSDQLIVVLYDETTMTSTPVTVIDGVDVNDTAFPATTINGLNSSNTYSLRFTYIAAYEWGVQIDNILIVSNCNPPIATTTIVPDCVNAQFSIDVDVTLNDATDINITNDADASKNVPNAGSGITTVGPFAAGTDVIITLEGTPYGGCDATLAAETEACACSTIPVAAVTSNAPDCGAGTFDIDVNITNLGGGTTANTGANIYVNNVLESSNVGLGTTIINKPVGTYTVYVEGIGGTGFATCVTADESAAAGCTNDVCADAFTVATDGTPTTSIDVSNYTNTPNGSCEHHLSNENTADAWFQFVAPTSGMVNISVDNTNLSGSGYESEAVLYDDCTLTSCTVDWIWSDYLENGNIATGLTPGTTYYLVVSNQQNQGGTAWTSGTFDVTIEDFAPSLSLGVKSCSQSFLYLDSPIDEKCPSSCGWFTDGDADAMYTYTPATTGTVDIKISDISDGGETLQELGFIFTSVAPFDTDGSCAGEACHASPLTTDLEANGIAVTGGTTYYLYVAYDGFDSTPSASFCATISSPCTGTTESISTPISDCTGSTYTGRINFSALGGAMTYELLDDMGTSITGVSSATDYDFAYTDLASHTVTLSGYDAGSNLVCVQEFSFTSGCNGSDAFSLTAPNILGTCSPGDLSVATAGPSGFVNCSGTTSGDTGNNVLRDCSATSFSNNTDFTDLWYQVDLPDGTDEMTIDITGLGAMELLGYVIYTGDPAGDGTNNLATVTSNTNLPCSFFDSSVTSHTITGLSDESTAPIYIRILPIEFQDGDNCNMVYPTFTICASAPQPNDVCNDAINITTNNLDNTGVASTGDLTLAADEGNAYDCTPAATAGTDLWYEILYPDVPSVIQTFFTELSLTGNAGDQYLINILDVTAACGSALPGSIDYCETITLTGGTDVTSLGNITSTDGQSREVQIIAVNATGPVTVGATVTYENNTCSHFQNVLPGYDITNPQPIDFNYSSDSGSQPTLAGSDLWYQFSPQSGNDNFLNIYSTSADITVSGLNTGEELTFVLYKGNTVSANNCNDLSADSLSLVTITGDGTFSQALSCLDETHGGANGGYLLQVIQTAGSTTALPTVTITPGPPGPSNNDPFNICSVIGSGPAIGPADNPSSDLAHNWNQFWIQNGETVSGSFVGANDCDYSAVCSTDYEAIQEVNDRDLWYVFEVPDNECATLGLTQSTVLYDMAITYNANDAFHDGIVYVYSACDPENIIDCSGALDGAGTTWTAEGLTQGEYYLLRVKPWDISSTPTDWSFDLTVNDGDVAPCNDKIENAEGLTVNKNCVNSPWYPDLETFSALGARDEETFGQNDVFFSFTAPLPANGGAFNPQTNPDGSFAKSWVTVFLENVSGHAIQMRLWNTQQIVATATQYTTSGTAGDKIWARFGNLIPGATYEIRLFHGETITTDVQYKIRIEASDNVTSTTECNAGDIEATPVLCGSCGGDSGVPYLPDPSLSLGSNGQNNHCEVWYKIDLPTMAGGAGTYWVAEVRGFEQVLDFELRQQIATESLVHGVQEDFDHPCSSRQLNSSMGTLVSTKAVTYEVDPGPIYNNNDPFPSLYDNAMGNEGDCQCTVGCSPDENTSKGGGFRKVYSDILGPAAGMKNYLYLRVFMDEDDPAYMACHDGGVLINPCQVIFKGPYSVDPTLDANGDNEVVPGEPDLACIIADASISFVSATSTVAEGNTIEVCVELQDANGTEVSADVIFDAVDAGTATDVTDYTIGNPTLPFTATFPSTAVNGDTLCFTINALTDIITDNNEIINFDLTNPVGNVIVDPIIEHTTTITEGAAVGSISGNVFLDLLANGLDDGTDTDIEGITVTLTNTGTGVTTTMPTAADGSYSFTGLADGDYTVTFGTNDGTITYDAFSGQNIGSDDTIDSDADTTTGTTAAISIAGNAVTDVDAGLFQNIIINGALFNNNDGTVGTMPVADGTTEDIIVTYCDDATCANPTNVTYSITTVNGDGSFSITTAVPGIISAINSTNYPFEETTVVNTQTNIVSGTTVSDQNFALYSISGNVFLDNYADGTTANLNGDGTGTDTDIEGITVTLTNIGTAATATTTTLADGSYIFTGLADGASYTVTFGTTDAAATTYDAFSAQDIGGDDLLDSEANASGVTNTITIASANVTDIDAGMYEYITISGALFSDNDGTVGTTPVINGTTETIIVTYCIDALCSATTNVSYPITTTGNTFSITDVAPGIISAVNSTNYTFEEASVVNAQTSVPSGGTVVEQDFAQEVNLPTAVDDTATTPPNTPVTITNLINDTFGTDGPSSTDITIVTNGTNGTAVVNDGGTPNNPTDDTVTYTPNPSFTGIDTVTYQICDSTGDCDTAVITISIGTSCNANAGQF